MSSVCLPACRFCTEAQRHVEAFPAMKTVQCPALFGAAHAAGSKAGSKASS